MEMFRAIFCLGALVMGFIAFCKRDYAEAAAWWALVAAMKPE